jgi:uncharacterized repeat protein (TIGR04138 family)
MREEEFAAKVSEIVKKDPRYSPEAYKFVSDAVLYTSTKVSDGEGGIGVRHVTGKELLNGIKEFAVKEYGPLAQEVLRSWGLTDSLAIGNVVFNMVDSQLLGRSEEDSIDDFKDGFNFDYEFTEPFRPAEKSSPASIPVID